MLLSPKFSKRRLATVALALTILFASSLPYLFLGPLPIWIACGLMCAGIAIFNRRFMASVNALGIVRWAIASWLILILITLMLDMLGYMLNYNERDVMSGSFLSFLTLLTFMGTLAATSFSNRSTVVAVIFSIAMLQGVVSILQFFEIGWAWSVSDMVIGSLPFLSRIEAQELSGMSVTDFLDIGRVKGTHIYVHIYNGIQSTLVAFCLFMTLHSESRERRNITRTLLGTLVVTVATIGLILSFSRSGVLAVFASLLLALLIKPSIKKVVGAAVVAIMIAAALSTLQFVNAIQFSRLLGVDINEATTQTRIEHLDYVLKNFSNNPLIGASGLPGIENLDLAIHSVPMRYLNDYGAIGFLLYFSVLAPFAIIFLRAFKSRLPGMAMWAGSGLCVLIAIASDSWTHSSGFLRRDIFHGVMLGLIVGSMIAIRRNAALSYNGGNLLSPSNPSNGNTSTQG